jgi:hypothetical protein
LATIEYLESLIKLIIDAGDFSFLKDDLKINLVTFDVGDLFKARCYVEP